MKDLIKLGTEYGGWFIPKINDLNENSIIYSGGVGEDISFDLLLNDIYRCKIFLIDPTKKAITHFEEVKKYYNNGDQFKGNIQVDYYDKIKGLNPDFTKFSYENIGLWNKKKSLKFYKQSNPNYVSQSLITNMFSDKYDIIKVDTIKSIMKKNKHTKIDLLKLDIEGAEIKVLNQMLNDNIKPKYLCIEFDLKLKKKDKDDLTNKILKRLSDNGYKILINDNLNITFELK